MKCWHKFSCCVLVSSVIKPCSIIMGKWAAHCPIIILIYYELLLPAFPLQRQCFSLMSSSYSKIMLACFRILHRESRMNLCINTLGVIIPNLLCRINKEPFFLCSVFKETHLSSCVSIKQCCPVKKNKMLI